MPAVKKSLGESLVEAGILTREQLEKAQAEEKKTGERFRKVIVRMGFIDEQDLVSFLSTKLGVPRIELENTLIDPKVVELIPEKLARKYEMVPVLKIGNRLTCAVVDPWNVFALDELRMKTGMTIEPAVATESEIKKVLDEQYGAKGTLEEAIHQMDEAKLGLKPGQEVDLQTLEGISKEPIVIRLVNLMILQAVKEGASDIHIEPEAETLKTRFRVDGILHEVLSAPKHLESAVISRLKILANLDIAERRLPQDGRFSLKLAGKEIDVRVSCMPTIYGENVVLRLLDVSSALLTLAELGFSKEVLQRYEQLILRPHGIILVTGPTGAGKTTTLYASLDKINKPDRNIITIEDPVEYRLAGIRQTQVHPKVKLTFAHGLRSLLRQDPDVIMVGEIRDRETAEVAVQAALTGHLVLSTLHTNDAAGAIARLLDMGVEPFLITSSVIGVLAQRLVRTLCKDCCEEYAPTQEALQDLGWKGRESVKLSRGKGCAKCRKTGYRGRIGIYELLGPNEKIKRLALARASSEEIRREALASGMVSLKDDGIRKVLARLTSVEEVLRVSTEE